MITDSHIVCSHFAALPLIYKLYICYSDCYKKCSSTFRKMKIGMISKTRLDAEIINQPYDCKTNVLAVFLSPEYFYHLMTTRSLNIGSRNAHPTLGLQSHCVTCIFISCMYFYHLQYLRRILQIYSHGTPVHIPKYH